MSKSIKNLLGGALISLMLILPAAAQGLYPLQPHPEGVSWPSESWQIGEMDGETALSVNGLIDEAMAGEKTGLMGETRSVVVIHGGQLVAERYRDGFGPLTKQISWSMAKSITSALVGRAVHEGGIEDIDAPMPSPFDKNDPRAAITWRNWLNMTDGLAWKEVDTPDLSENNVVQMMFGPGKMDVLDYIKTEVDVSHPPGEVWNYSTAAFHLAGSATTRLKRAESDISTLSGVIEDIETDVGLNSINMKDCASFSPIAGEPVYSNCFLTHLGIDAQPEFDPAGTFLGGSNIWMGAHDYAKFGYLYLRDGVWEDERILPEGWVDFSRTVTPAENSNVYGAGFWVNPPEGEPRSHRQAAKTCPCDSFHAGGSQGQTIWIVPSRDLVIVRTGLMTNDPANWAALYEWNQKIARSFPEVALNAAPEIQQQ